MSVQSCLVGVVVPDPEVLPGFAKDLGCLGSMEELCKNTVMFLCSVFTQTQSICVMVPVQSIITVSGIKMIP